jgi:hypothetical protein
MNSSSRPLRVFIAALWVVATVFAAILWFQSGWLTVFVWTPVALALGLITVALVPPELRHNLVGGRAIRIGLVILLAAAIYGSLALFGGGEPGAEWTLWWPFVMLGLTIGLWGSHVLFTIFLIGVAVASLTRGTPWPQARADLSGR